MKKILMAMTALGALAVAAPAVAQYPNRNMASGGMDVRIGHLQTRLQAGVQQGTISQREAMPLRMQLRALTRLERQYSLNGLDRRERADLQLRIRDLRQRIRVADGGGYDRWDRDDRYADDDRRDRDGRWDDRDGRRYVDSRYDSNRDGWDDRDRDRDGRWEDDVNDDRRDRMDANRDGWDDRDYDRDGRWDDDLAEGRYQQRDNRGLLERVIDSATGGGLRVGQRASANLGAVPYEYRGQYRDGNGAYYRSDGRAIYQIDARAHTVVRVYPLSR